MHCLFRIRLGHIVLHSIVVFRSGDLGKHATVPAGASGTIRSASGCSGKDVRKALLDVRRDLTVAKAGLLVGNGQYGKIAIVWIHVYLLSFTIMRKKVTMKLQRCKKGTTHFYLVLGSI